MANLSVSLRKQAKLNPVSQFWQNHSKEIIPPLVGITTFLVVWQVLSSTGVTRLPGPTSLWTDQRTRELMLYPFYDLGGLDKGLFWQTLASLGRVAQGYGSAVVVGITLGILVGTNDWLNRATYPIFQFLRMVAPLAWVPIALVALQQNQPAAIFVIFITSVWPILINTIEGVHQIPEDYKNVAKVLQLSRKEYYLNILFPAALPYIFTGLRIAIGLAWLAIIAAEIVMSGIVGIGFFIWDAYQQNYISEIILAVIYIGGVGLLLDRSITFIQMKIAPSKN